MTLPLNILSIIWEMFLNDKMSKNIKQFRQHGVDHKFTKNDSFKEVLDHILKILKKNYIYVFTDPKINNDTAYLLNAKSHKKTISKFVYFQKKYCLMY